MIPRAGSSRLGQPGLRARTIITVVPENPKPGPKRKVGHSSKSNAASADRASRLEACGVPAERIEAPSPPSEPAPPPPSERAEAALLQQADASPADVAGESMTVHEVDQ